jgi:drug/metabolite transporter (DMT)-like permease
MPIFAMILAAVFLKEPITGKKALGVLMGCSGALILILTSAAATTDKVGDIRGDLLCLGAQFSFALYLSLFNPLIRRYSVFTINRWMFLWATIIVIPLTLPHLLSLQWSAVTVSAWWEAAYVVVFGTFIGYILTMIGQRTLRPTVVSIYNYVQPIVSVTVSIFTGIGIFRWSQALAVILVFVGVWQVTKSKSRRDMEREAKRDASSKEQ